MTARTSRWSSRGGAHRAPAGGSARRRVLGATAFITAITAIAAVALLSLRPGTVEGSARDGEPSPAAAAVVAWSQAHLPAGTPVTVPDDVRAEVLAAGGDEASFRSTEQQDPGALRLVEGRPPEGSLVLASFADPDGAALSLLDPSPGRPPPDELARRERLAAAILANPATGATGRAAEVLELAHVDARLLGLLAVLASQRGAGIADLPPAPGEPATADPSEAPLVRTVLIDSFGEEPVGAGRPATEDLLAFLDAQQPPYAPDTVEVTDDGVRIAYRYESAPDVLVGEP